MPACQTEGLLQLGPAELCARLRRNRTAASVFLDGSGGFGDGWSVGPLVAVDPACRFVHRNAPGNGPATPLDLLDRRLQRRRQAGGTAETGLALLLGYDLFGTAPRPTGGLPDMVVFEVDRSVRFLSDGRVRLTVWPGSLEGRPGEAGAPELLARLEALESPAVRQRDIGPTSAPNTSLPREAYLAAVTRIKRDIAAGEIYQANLCQQFRVGYAADELDLYRELVRRTPAPRSAFVSWDGGAVASVSPETFLHLRPPDLIETRPIKGTRPRGATPEADRAAAQGLVDSPKDRAELLMIVDLERNDLGRVCRAGSVRVPDLAALVSFPAVHHLVARVEGRLRAGTRTEAILRATFPGGSITGAPKIRAMQILHDIEPVRRNFFTGSLFWFGDDGSMDSSILIRTVVFDSKLALLGAGGGIVADSQPEQEWQESNHKARALAGALGFDPEEAR